MKIWYGFGSEHSANLVIIGTFSSAKTAREALDLLNEAARVAREDEAAGRISAGKVSREFSDGIMDLFRRTNLSLGYGGAEELLYDFDATQDGNKVVITTDETMVNSFINVLVHKSAKVELYSAHDHDSPYGRRTRS